MDDYAINKRIQGKSVSVCF